MVIAYLLISVNNGYEMSVAKKLMDFNEVNDVHIDNFSISEKPFS